MLELSVVEELKHIHFREIFWRDGEKQKTDRMWWSYSIMLTFSTVNRTKQSIGIEHWDIKIVACLQIDLNINWNNNIHLFKLNVPV